jgi:hypothetical protein
MYPNESHPCSSVSPGIYAAAPNPGDHGLSSSDRNICELALNFCKYPEPGSGRYTDRIGT